MTKIIWYLYFKFFSCQKFLKLQNIIEEPIQGQVKISFSNSIYSPKSNTHNILSQYQDSIIFLESIYLFCFFFVEISLSIGRYGKVLFQFLFSKYCQTIKVAYDQVIMTFHNVVTTSFHFYDLQKVVNDLKDLRQFLLL